MITDYHINSFWLRNATLLQLAFFWESGSEISLVKFLLGQEGIQNTNTKRYLTETVSDSKGGNIYAFLTVTKALSVAFS